MKLQELAYNIIIYVGWIVSFPFMIGLFRRKYITHELRIIFFLICNNMFFELLSRILIIYKLPNLYLFHFYVLIESLFISWFYYEIFKRHLSPKIIPTLYIIFISFSLVDTFVWHNPFSFNSYAKTLECCMIVTYAVFYLYKTFDDFQDEDPSDTPVFWINAGFLFYFSGCLFLFTFSNFIRTQSKEINILVWALHAFFMIIMYLLITIGFWKSPLDRKV